MLTSALFATQKEMLDERGLDLILRNARTHNGFAGPVTDEQLRAIYELMLSFGEACRIE